MVSDFSTPISKSVRIVGCGGRVRVSGGHLCAKHRSTDRGGSRDLEPTVLYFLCGENTAVGSVALTVHRTVIYYHLTLRVFALLATLVALITLDIDRLKFFFVVKNENSHLMVTVFIFGKLHRFRCRHKTIR